MNFSAIRTYTPYGYFLIVACFVGIAVSCASPQQTAEPAPTPTLDIEGDRQAVIDAHNALMEAYQTGDVEAFVGLLDNSSELLIFHPRLQSRYDGIDKVREGLAQMFARLGQASWQDVHASVTVQGDVAWLTSHIAIESPNVAEPFVGRGTEIWIRQAGGWRLTHAHWSANPEVGG